MSQFVERNGELFKVLVLEGPGAWLISHDSPASPFFVGDMDAYQHTLPPSAQGGELSAAGQKRLELIQPLLDAGELCSQNGGDMFQLGVHAVISIIIYLITVGLSFQAIKALRVEKFIRKNHNFEAQILLLFIAIALGFLVGNFVITFIDQSMQLSNFF